MVFWLVSFGIAALVALPMALALFRRGPVEGSAAFDVQVYRDQLKEVERDLARGVVTEAEAEQVRIEVSRRLLEADKAAQAEASTDNAPRALSLGAAAVVGIAVLGGTFLLYRDIGAPGYPDLPLSKRIELAEEARLNRPGQADAETEAARLQRPLPDPDPSYAELVEQLRTTVAERPDDLQGHILLARAETNLGNFIAAWKAQARVVEIRGAAASAEDHADLADLMILAAGGYVSPEAEAVLSRVLEMDPRNGTARYYSGLLAAQTGRPDVAFRIWRALLEQSGADAPWLPPILAQIEDVAQLAGVDYVAPAGAMRGPSQADIAAAEDLTPEARMQMIEGMVQSLSERLAAEGGPPEDWARLIRAYGVLGNRDAAAAIWAEAQEVFPDPVVQIPLLRAAQDAGVAQ